MVIGVILAAGKGSRMKLKDANKTSVFFNGKPLIQYGVTLFQNTADKTVIVVGAHAESVKESISLHDGIHFAEQKHRLGTGHAVRVAAETMKTFHTEPQFVLVGYGDHMMFYTEKVINQLIELHKKQTATLSLITTTYKDPNFLAWGRIVRSQKNGKEIERIVEQKDATEEERAITEINPGFYCFDYQFLKKALKDMTKSPITKEYYLTELIEIASKYNGKIVGLKVPFKYVGIGINTKEQLGESISLYNEKSV